jgi:hypothetical protein
MLGFDVFESGLADIPFLGVYHWLRIFMEFEGCFCEKLGLV